MIPGSLATADRRVVPTDPKRFFNSMEVVSLASIFLSQGRAHSPPPPPAHASSSTAGSASPSPSCFFDSLQAPPDQGGPLHLRQWGFCPGRALSPMTCPITLPHRIGCFGTSRLCCSSSRCRSSATAPFSLSSSIKLRVSFGSSRCHRRTQSPRRIKSPTS